MTTLGDAGGYSGLLGQDFPNSGLFQSGSKGQDSSFPVYLADWCGGPYPIPRKDQFLVFSHHLLVNGAAVLQSKLKGRVLIMRLKAWTGITPTSWSRRCDRLQLHKDRSGWFS